MYMLSVTISATGTPQRFIGKSPVIDNSNTAFQNLIPQNNGMNNMYIGDSQVSMTNSIILGPQGSFNGSMPLAYASDLKDFWVIGTSGDILNLMVFP